MNISIVLKIIKNLLIISKKECFFSIIENGYPNDKEQEKTKKIFRRFNIKNKNGEELTENYLKSVLLLLTCVFEKFKKVSVIGVGFNTLYCVSLPGYTWQCGLKYTGINVQTLQNKDMIFVIR